MTHLGKRLDDPAVSTRNGRYHVQKCISSHMSLSRTECQGTALGKKAKKSKEAFHF